MVAARLTAQLLAGPPVRDPAAVAERLLAIQAQDPRGARLAIRARSDASSAAHVDGALDDRELVVSWLNRGTLHLVRSEDYAWLHGLTTPPLFTGNARRLGQEGVTAAAAERGVAAVVAALADEGPLTRAALRDRLDAAGVRTAGQALVHVLMLASLRGLVVRGPMAGREQAFALVRDWLGEPTAVDRDAALGELARRYLAGHGPASDRDLARWSGLPLGDARAGLERVAGKLERGDDGLVDLAGRPAAAELPPPRLLGAFEPLLLGWTSREPFVRADAAQLVATGGLFRPVALVGGRAAATWRLRGAEVELDPFERLSRADRDALRDDGRELVRYLGVSA